MPASSTSSAISSLSKEDRMEDTSPADIDVSSPKSSEPDHNFCGWQSHSGSGAYPWYAGHKAGIRLYETPVHHKAPCNHRFWEVGGNWRTQKKPVVRSRTPYRR
ncbi:hypothetical protein AMELA_G00075980 [Ameiurus melas]|uniref:Uncharacterized protein n=1 Tax=Ameiurus melas TaxID=219545 RepID=A0A7J6AYC1_AMEME|nr:hypothetical protein AMELA_G00075980 [Ameiurus melas]